MIWASFTTIEPKHLSVSAISVYPSIKETNVSQSVWQLKLGPNQVEQKGTDPKHSTKSTAEWLKKKGI